MVQPNSYTTGSEMFEAWIKSGPTVTKEQMEKNNQKMVGCWLANKENMPEIFGGSRGLFKHAVYIKEWESVKVEEGNSYQYKFDCMNSWGELQKYKPTPQLCEKDLSEVYLVSLYTEKDNFQIINKNN